MPRILWSPELVIAAIRDRNKKNQALLSGHVARERRSLWWAANKYFGKWHLAVKAAGLDYEQIFCTQAKPYPGEVTPSLRRVRLIKPSALESIDIRTASRDELLVVIRRICELGERIHYQVREKTLIYVRACEMFGSWKNAVALAGFDPRMVSKQFRQSQTGIPGVPLRIISLDELRFSGSTKTRGDYIGEIDPGFERFEGRDLLQALLSQRKLAKEMGALLERVLLGYDLKPGEYEQLAAAIHQHPELAKLLETI